MIRIRRSAIVSHRPERMFDLVNDVEAYPRHFVWCAKGQVLAREADEITARLDLRLSGLTWNFTTRNTLRAPHRIEMRLVAGPLRTLYGEWDFAPLGETGCKVSFALDFDYSGLTAPLLRLGFQKLADRMVDDFCAEADRAFAAAASGA